MFAILSIYGLYTYDSSLFDNMALPDGIDKDVLIMNIITECSDFALLYPNFDFMKMLIGVWSKNEYQIWDSMQRSTEFEYNPIENYDRHETITRNVTGTEKGNATNTDSSTNNTSAERVSGRTAFDSNSIKDVTKNNESGESSNVSNNIASSERDASSLESATAHIHGNIGVTTAQQMIAGFREISNFSVYDFITHSFKDRFCVEVY